MNFYLGHCRKNAGQLEFSSVQKIRVSNENYYTYLCLRYCVVWRN